MAALVVAKRIEADEMRQHDFENDISIQRDQTVQMSKTQTSVVSSQKRGEDKVKLTEFPSPLFSTAQST